MCMSWSTFYDHKAQKTLMSTSLVVNIVIKKINIYI